MVNPIETPNSDDKLWAGLSYVGVICCFVPTIVILLMKQGESRFIKFHALQALSVGLIAFVLNVILSGLGTALPFLGLIFGLGTLLLSVAFIGIWIFLIIMAFTGKDVRIPVLAEFLEQKLMG